MPLHPFTLAETEEYFQKNGFRWKRLSLLQVYMVIQTTSTIFPTMITTFGLAKGMYSDQITTKLTLDDLF